MRLPAAHHRDTHGQVLSNDPQRPVAIRGEDDEAVGEEETDVGRGPRGDAEPVPEDLRIPGRCPRRRRRGLGAREGTAQHEGHHADVHALVQAAAVRPQRTAQADAEGKGKHDVREVLPVSGAVLVPTHEGEAAEVRADPQIGARARGGDATPPPHVHRRRPHVLEGGAVGPEARAGAVRAPRQGHLNVVPYHREIGVQPDAVLVERGCQRVGVGVENGTGAQADHRRILRGRGTGGRHEPQGRSREDSGGPPRPLSHACSLLPSQQVYGGASPVLHPPGDLGHAPAARAFHARHLLYLRVRRKPTKSSRSGPGW